MMRKKVYSDILPQFAHCLTKNLLLDSSQIYLYSKYFPTLQQDLLFS